MTSIRASRLIAAFAVLVAVLVITQCGDTGPDPGRPLETPAQDEIETETLPGARFDPDAPFAAVTRDRNATLIGYRVLEEGGSAADAAFAIGVAISVSEPHFSHSLGGGTWALYYDSAEESVSAIDGVGSAGSLVDVDFFRDPRRNTYLGMHRVIVPGGWDAWMVMLDRYGTMELDELLAPAITLARKGVAVTRSLAGFILEEERHIRRFTETAEIFLPDGIPPGVGDTLYQHNLADTLELIAETYRAARPEGRARALQAARDVYYRGPIGEAIVAYSEQHGGFLTTEDFAGFEAEIVEPISTDYRDITVYSPPPNSQGIAMLMALNILEGFDFSGYEPDHPYVIHRVVEATKLAKIDTWLSVGDPQFVDVPIDELLSAEYADRQRRRIDPGGVITWPTHGGLSRNHDTTTFSVLDRRGNAAAVTTSIGSQFLIAGETGINLNQRMANMETTEGNPNVIKPGKKVRHTVNPYMAFRDGSPFLLGGNTGFDTQPQGQIQQFLNVVEFGMSAQEAVSRPRYITHAFPSSTFPYEATNLLYLERGIAAQTRRELTAIGHTIGGSAIIGNANLTMIGPFGATVTTGADPRGENLGLAGPQ